MEVNMFEKVSQLFRSIDSTVIAANILDKAYADGVGKPEYHTPFGADNPEKVAMAIAGLYAADTAANLLAMMERGLLPDGSVFSGSYYKALCRLAHNSDDLSPGEVYIVMNAANLSWRTGQPFRDISTKPLQRITREVNMQFNQLSKEEQIKDLVQIVAGAKILLDWIDRA